MTMDEEDGAKKSTKPGFCYKGVCNFIVLAVIVVVIVVFCVVTAVDKNIREVKKYDPSSLEWWQKTIIYQIYPRSYQDTDGDGIGDLQGIIKRLDHLEYIGIGAVWISPFYKSPMKDFGYDIENFTDIDPMFGNMTDFDELMIEAKKRGIKIIMDFVPNHSSDISEWFQKSRQNDTDYRDYYIWRDGKMVNGKLQPPNNWVSVFGGPAWEFDNLTNQYYYHAFLIGQPDLNYRNPKVVQNMENAMRFWAKKGVAGFRLDAVKMLFEVEDVSLDEVGMSAYLPSGKKAPYLDEGHNLTTNLPGVFKVIEGWRSMLDKLEADDDLPRFMVGESYALTSELKRKYFNSGAVPFDFGLIEKMDRNCGGTCTKNIITESLNGVPEGSWPSFVLGNHDRNRVASRFGSEMVDVLNMLLLTLPGTPTTYYGEEIGMPDAFYTFNQSRDPAGLNYGEDGYLNTTRDPERSPMQWDDTRNAGFSTGTPWLHVGASYNTTNVKMQKNDKKSPMELYRRLAKLRQYEGFQTSLLHWAFTNDDVLSYTRYADGWYKHLVILNLGQNNKATTYDYSAQPVGSTTGIIVETTNNIHNSDMARGKTIDLSKVSLPCGQGLVIRVTH